MSPVSPIADGTYTVGVDVPVGMWHTDGPRAVRAYGVEKAPQCSWRMGWPGLVTNSPVVDRLTSLQEDHSGPTNLNLAPEGIVFFTKGCKPWRLTTG
jgi:hypothetical protein